MSTEKATALVLDVVEFSETSSVVTLFTREFGKIQRLGQGCPAAERSVSSLPLTCWPYVE